MRKLRAGLTTLGVVIGIAAIVALLSITQGLQNTITVQLQTGLATDTLIVSTGGGFGFGRADSGFKLLVNDTQAINQIENVETSIAIIQRVGYVKFGERSRITTITGVDFAKYANIYSTTFVAESGDIPQNPGNETVVVGKRVSDPWKNGTILSNVEDTAQIIWTNAALRPPENKTYFGTVKAVLNEIGGFGIGGPSDSSVYIPISQAQSFFGTNEVNTIIVKLKSSDKATIDSISKAITDTFSNEVSVLSSTAVLNTLTSVFSIIQFFLGGIAAISLLVAGIGIMNIMIVSLMERTREIGVLKALGMKSRTVLLIFLCESVMIGLIGAAIGIAAGWSLANVVSRTGLGGGGFGGFSGTHATATDGLTITPVLSPVLFVGAFAFGVIVSVIFAMYPAWRASRLKPVEALRYE